MDISILLGFQELRNALGQSFARVVTAFSDLVLNPVLYIILAGIFWCINKKKGILYIFTIIGGNFLNCILKVGFCVFRPWIRDSRIIPFDFSLEGATGYSFPSGHSTSAAAFMSMIAWTERKKRKTVITCFVIMMLIGLSRLYLGVHTPQDVLVGWASGLLSTLLIVRMIQWVDQKPGNDIVLLISSLILLTAGLLLTMLRSYPTMVNDVQVIEAGIITHDTYSGIGMGFGLVIGWFVQKRWIRFEINGSRKDKWIRFLIGAAGMAIVYFLPKKILYSALGDNWGRFALYFLTLVYALILYPCVIRRMQKE